MYKIKRFIVSNWLTWLCRLSYPTFCGWKPRRVNGVVLVWVWRTENRRTNAVVPVQRPAGLRTRKSWCSRFSPEEGNRQCPNWNTSGKKNSFLPGRGLSSFVLFKPSIDLMRPTHIRESYLLYSVYWFELEFCPEILTDILRIMFNQISGHPMAQSIWFLSLDSAMIPHSDSNEGPLVDFAGYAWRHFCLDQDFSTIEKLALLTFWTKSCFVVGYCLVHHRFFGINLWLLPTRCL